MKTLKIFSLIAFIAALFFSCQKEYSIEGIVTPPGTWQFNDSTKLYAGNMDSAYIETTGSTKTLSLVGRSSDGLQNFLLHLYATDSFTVGEYKASAFQTDFQYYTQSKTIYQADQFIGEFIVTITAIGNNSISGIFSGDSEDSTKAIKPLTLGKFTSRINLSTNGTGGGGGAGSATGTLGSSAGVCAPISINGTYTQGIALDSTNTVQVQVTVATPGAYTISTNTVNGVGFSKSGTFTGTGLQNVILKGTGIPVNSGSQNFTVTFSGTTCNFAINFGAGTPPVTTNYFPTTIDSYWSYGKQGGTPKDSILIKVMPNTLAAGGYNYSIFTVDSIPPSGNPDSLYYRRAGGDYIEYFNTQAFFAFDGPGNPPAIEYIFLKDYVPQGSTWQSQNFSGTFGGTTYTLYIKMTLLAKSVTATSGSVTSTDVMKVKYEYFATIAPATPFATEERWFAKDIGLIYNSFDYGSGVVIYTIGSKLVL